VDSSYAIQYRDLYYHHWWWRARERLILRTIEEVLRSRSTDRILDIGCGDGFLFDYLSKYGAVEGVESDESLVSDGGSWRHQIMLSAFDDSFQPGKRYSLILMLDVLEHIKDDVRSLQRAVELLDVRGNMILTVPAFRCLWTSHDDLNKHFRRYTKASLVKLSSEVGLRVVTCRYFFHWMFPIKLLLHTKERCFGAIPKVPKSPQPFINQTLFRLSICEHKLLGRLPIPFGNSIVLVGQKP
jgi:trans-aconitate methyltransferase